MSRLLTFEHRDPGADVLVLTNAWPHGSDPKYGVFIKRQVDSLLAAGLRCEVLFVRGFESPCAYLAAALLLTRVSCTRRCRYRLVHGHGGETSLPCLLFLRGPRIVSFCGDDLLGTPDGDGRISRASWIKSRVLRRLARGLSATITKSREMESRLPTRAKRRNTVLPNGVDRELFKPGDRDKARATLGWPAAERVALFAADPTVPRKRHWLALAACAESERRGLPVRLHVASDVAPSQMPVVMSAADCLLMTSSIEGSPNVVKEALMCNLPVVATRAGDVEDLLEDVRPSQVCEPTADALARGLLDCLREARRSNGREQSEWLDEKRIAQRILEMYVNLVRSTRLGAETQSITPRCGATPSQRRPAGSARG